LERTDVSYMWVADHIWNCRVIIMLISIGRIPVTVAENRFD